MARVHRLAASPETPRSWHRWMRAFGEERDTYHHQTGFDPMQLGEQATVGLMLTAAVRLDHVGVLEYGTTKRHPTNDEGRYGRCDFWAIDTRDAAHPGGWALEVKRSRLSPRTSSSRIGEVRKLAWDDAGELLAIEASLRIACTIFFSEKAVSPEWPCERRLSLEMKRTDWSWKVSSDVEGLHPLYVLFDVRRRGRRRGPADQN